MNALASTSIPVSSWVAVAACRLSLLLLLAAVRNLWILTLVAHGVSRFLDLAQPTRVAVPLPRKDKLSISVRDDGTGMPEGFDLAQAKGLGMRIVTSFVTQLKGTIKIRCHNPGTEFVVILPR